MNEKILNFAKISTLAVLLAFGITQVSSWTAPTAVPPDGNVSAPINVGNATQTKAGNLTVGSLTSNGDIDVTGDNLMNVATPIAPADGVNKAYVDAQSTINNVGVGGDGYASFSWGYTDKHYFVTKNKYDGNLGGYAGANAKCNVDANAIQGKTYYALFQLDQTSNVSFGKIGIGLYNDEYGWVNSNISVSNPVYIGAAGLMVAVVNNNQSGKGSSVFSTNIDLLYSLQKPSDFKRPYLKTSNPIWSGFGCRVSSNTEIYTTNTVNEAGHTTILRGSDTEMIGTWYASPVGNACNQQYHLLCVEN